MDSMIRELYNNGWISKSTAEHYLQIYDIGTKAAKGGDNGAYNANQAYHVLSQEIYSFADSGKAPRGRRPAGSRPQQSRNRSAGSRQSGSGMQPTDLLKFVVPIVLVIILIILMYLGRVGGLTLIYAALSGHRIRLGKYPLEKITVG